MTIVISALFLLVFLVVLATLGNEGMWSNAIVLFNVVTAALVATNFWEPIVAACMKSAPSYVYLWDFLALWGLFAATYVVLRLATDNVSRVRVRFPKLADMIGSYVFALIIGWALVCFLAMTLHTAPLSRNFLFGGFQPEQSQFFGLAPDRQWLGFMQKQSMGSFSRGAPADQPEAHVFDPRGEFMIKYATRRGVMEKGVTVLAK